MEGLAVAALRVSVRVVGVQGIHCQSSCSPPTANTLQSYVMIDITFFMEQRHYALSFSPPVHARNLKWQHLKLLNRSQRKMEHPRGQSPLAVRVWEEVSLPFFKFPRTLGSHYYSGIPPDTFMTVCFNTWFIICFGASLQHIPPSATLSYPVRCYNIACVVIASCKLAKHCPLVKESTSGP